MTKPNTPSHTKRALITAYIGSENIGDEAIFESLIRDLNENSIEITAVSKNVEKTEKLGVKAVKPYSLKFIKALMDSDLVLLGGGGILQDQTSIYNIPYFIIQILLAQLLRKKTMLVAVGAGPIKGRVGKSLIALSMKKINAITVRDTYSYHVLKKLGADEKKMHVSTDPAIALVCDTMKKPDDIPDELFQKPYLVVCLRHWFDLNRFLPVALSNKLQLSYRGRQRYRNFITTMAKCLDLIVEETSLPVIFFPFYGTRDIKVNRDAMREMQYKDKAFLINQPQHIHNFYFLVAHAEFVISMRLHSAIVSAALNTPSIALSYSPKVREFMKSLGMEEFVLDLDHINEKSVLNLARKILQNRTQICSEVGQNAARLKEVNKKNIEIILTQLR